jgi:hypothetical protein
MYSVCGGSNVSLLIVMKRFLSSFIFAECEVSIDYGEIGL